MARNQTAQVIITCNASQAKKAIDEIKTHAAQLRQQYNQLAKEYDRVVATQGKDSKAAKDLNRELKRLETTSKTLDKAIKVNEVELGDLDKIMKNLSGSTTRQLRTALSRLKRELENTSGNDLRHLREVRSQMQAIERQITKNTGAVAKHGSAWQTSIRNIGTYISMFAGLHQAIAKVGQIFRQNLDMSDQLSQIRMVSGLAMKDVNKLSDALKGVDTRSSLTELQQIAYEGSKLGFGQYGVSGLKEFTEAANQVNVALKEQMGEDTLPMMSKMVENMGLIKKMGVEKALLATGSAMFRLSASSTSSAGNIMEFAKRLAGLASTSHITTDQLLALGSASDSMMLMPEVAATAFNKLITAVQAHPKAIAKAFHIPEKDFVGLLEQGKTMEAIVQIFEKMNKMGGMNATKPMMKILGSDGARLINVVVSMAGHIDMLKDHLDTAKDAFEEASDVTQEYNLRQETAQGYLERANNLWSKAFINKDGVEVMKGITREWYNMSQAMTNSYGIMVPLKAMLSLLVLSLRGILYILPEILAFLGGAGLTRVVIFLTGAIKDLTLGIKAAAGAQIALNAAQKANIFGLIASGITILVSAFSALYQHIHQANEAQKEYNYSIGQLKSSISSAKMQLDSYYRAIKKTKEGTEERKQIVKEFNQIYGSYLKNQVKETDNANALAQAYQRVNNALQNKIVLEAKDKEKQATVTPRYGWSANRLNALNESLEGTRFAPYGGRVARGFVEDSFNSGKGVGRTILDYFKHIGLNLSQTQKNAVIETRGQLDNQKLAKYLQGKYGNSTAFQQRYSTLTGGGQEMNIARLAAAFISQYSYTLSKNRSIDRKYDSFLTPEPDDDTLTFKNDDTQDKLLAKQQRAAAAAERARIAKAKKAMREELQQAKTESTAIISNIEAYYNLQQAALDDMVKTGEKSAAQVAALTAQLKIHKNNMLAQARFALSGQKNNFNELRQTMGPDSDQFDYSEKSEGLKKAINSVDLNAAYRRMARFDGSEAVYGISAGSLLDEINKNGTKNLADNAEVQRKQAEAVQAILDSYNVLSDVNKTFADDLTKIGINIDTLSNAAQEAYDRAQMAKRKSTPATTGEMAQTDAVNLNEVGVTGVRGYDKDYINSMLKQFIQSGYHPYADDISTDEGMYRWMQGLTSNYTTDKNGKPQMTNWARSWSFTDDIMRQLNSVERNDDGTLDADDLKEKLDPIRNNIKLFYFELMKYGDDYYDKLKKDADRVKRIISEMWDRSEEQKKYEEATRQLNQLSNRDTIYGRPQNDWQPFGFSKTIRGDDTEVNQGKNNLQSAQEQYQMAQMRTSDPTILKEYLDKIDEAQFQLEQTVANRVTERMTELKQWTDPIENLGTAMGEAFAQMTEDAEKGRDAVKAALLDMVKAYAQSGIKIISELMMQQVKRKLIEKTMNKTTKKSTQENTSIKEEGNKQIMGAEGQFTSGLMSETTKRVNETKKASKEQSDSNKEQVVQDATTDTQGGIVSGAAKIIAKLGWWGIPLVAVITALLNGLLAAFLSKLGKGGSTEKAATNTKLKTGMLTYDSGNVQQYRGIIDGKSYPVVGNDGRVYAATSVPEAVTGIVNSPIATMINGQPSLVGERGPELVVGRETTAAMMMNRPDLLREIIRYDKNRSGMSYKAYDSGNIQDLTNSVNSLPDNNSDMQPVLESLQLAVASLTQRLQRPIQASINLYGTGGLVDAQKKGAAFMNKHR